MALGNDSGILKCWEIAMAQQNLSTVRELGAFFGAILSINISVHPSIFLTACPRVGEGLEPLLPAVIDQKQTSF